MTERKTRTPKGTGKKAEKGTSGDRASEIEPENVDVSWDQPQPRYPAPERPLDRAEERDRDA